MPEPELAAALEAYKTSRALTSKGKIGAMIFASRLARTSRLPFDVEAGIAAKGEGQVKGLGKTSVQAILADYGIQRILAEENGRTSRGSLGNIRSFLTFLNGLHAAGKADTAAVEAWWVDQAKRFFNAKPFMLRFESGKSLRFVIRELLIRAAAADALRDRSGEGLCAVTLQQYAPSALRRSMTLHPSTGQSHDRRSTSAARSHCGPGAVPSPRGHL